MSENEKFYEKQTEQSSVKEKIVSSYFTAWLRVLKKWGTPLGYYDLFCGPGRYVDQKETAPLFIVKEVLNDSTLAPRMHLYFNDENPQNVHLLQRNIEQIDRTGILTPRIKYEYNTVKQGFECKLNIPDSMPVLSFVDPFGYKGLTLSLLDYLVSNQGSDCIFFFNYNRVNMAINNPIFDEHLIALFGNERITSLKERINGLMPAQREPVVLDALIEALTASNSNYVLPFKFYSKEMLRTSHFIIFITKHKAGCKIMKSIMYTNSAKDSDGVATFSFEDSHNFIQGLEQLSFFTQPLQSLMNELMKANSSRTIKVRELCDQEDTNMRSHFVGANVKEALRRLEEEQKIMVVSGRKQKKRNGKLNMPDEAVVRFF